MPWARLDDKFHSHPKVASLGDYMLACVGLHALALSWCNDHLTDGFIPNEQVPRLTGDVSHLLSEGDPGILVARLLEAGMWEQRENGYEIHDFLEYNNSRKDVLKARKLSSNRVDRWRQRNASGNGVGNATVTDVPKPSRTRTSSEQDLSPPQSSPPVEFSIPTSISEALRRCTRLGAVPGLSAPAFWRAEVRANEGVDFGAEILRAEAWLVANPTRAPRKDLGRFLHNWLARAQREEG